MEALIRYVRWLASVRRHSQLGAYAAIASIPSAVAIATLLYRTLVRQREEKARLVANQSHERAREVVKALQAVATYRPTPWMLVRL